MQQHKYKIFYVELDHGSNFAQFTIAGNWLKTFAIEFGTNIDLVKVRNESDLFDLLLKMKDSRALFLINVWLYDLRLSFFPDTMSKSLDLFTDHKNCFAYITDHPFATFMYDRIRRASSNVKYSFIDESQHRSFQIISGVNPQSRRINSIVLPRYLYESLPKYETRAIDILVPSNIGDEYSFAIDRVEPHIKQTLLEAINRNPYHLQLNSFDSFEELYQQNFNHDLQCFHDTNQEMFKTTILNIGIADNNWRHKFRRNEIDQIARQNPDLNIFVAGKPDTTIQSSNVKFIGFQPFQNICNLIANAKCVLHLHPTYFDGLHDRPLTAPAFGTPVITRKMRWTRLLRSMHSHAEYEDPSEFRTVYLKLIKEFDKERAIAAMADNFAHHGTEKFLKDLEKPFQ
jgi:hypothetical protein